MLEDKIAQCEAVVHIVGMRYGAEPDPATLPEAEPRRRRSYTQMEVSFSPDDGLTYSAVVDIASNDPDEPVVYLDLTGSDQPIPDIDVDPTYIDYGTVAVGNYATEYAATRDRWERTFRAVRERGGRSVIWGAGSKGVSFLTNLGVGDLAEVTPERGMELQVLDDALDAVSDAMTAEQMPDVEAHDELVGGQPMAHVGLDQGNQHPAEYAGRQPEPHCPCSGDPCIVGDGVDDRNHGEAHGDSHHDGVPLLVGKPRERRKRKQALPEFCLCNAGQPAP